MLGALVQIIAEDDPLRSDTTLLIAALCALGIPPAGRDLFCATSEFVRGESKWRVIWSLRGVSTCKRFNTVEMQKAWADGAWLLNHPTHPLAILRGALTYERAFKYSPRFTLAELAIENTDTWVEGGIRNLIFLLRGIPQAAQSARDIIRFGPRWAAMVPQNLDDGDRSKLLRYVEAPGKRPETKKVPA